MYLSLGRGAYLGGLGDATKQTTGMVLVTDDAIGIGTMSPEHPAITVGRIRSVDVEASQVAASRLAATVAFGALGALAAKGTTDRTTIVVRVADGDTAFFRVDNLTAPEVMGKLSPWMKAHGLRASDDVRHAEAMDVPRGGGVAEQLEQLASLHAAGILTADEFGTAKARVLR